ncbi:hypothetical protein GCM10008957_46630 [Deinococcus ruber]|uniref:Uncharacterized protein n=1 Tax=Deinococcus ruber TaxID=1848197 RepID=A0A918CL97_9DEIO|nr:hypothetical protein GCM10008957_46630 [Deinococcus ruber]
MQPASAAPKPSSTPPPPKTSDPSDTGVQAALVPPDPALAATFVAKGGLGTPTDSTAEAVTPKPVRPIHISTVDSRPLVALPVSAPTPAPVPVSPLPALPPAATSPVIALSSAPLPVPAPARRTAVAVPTAPKVPAPAITSQPKAYVPPAALPQTALPQSAAAIPLPSAPAPTPLPTAPGGNAVVYTPPPATGTALPLPSQRTTPGPVTLTRPDGTAIPLPSTNTPTPTAATADLHYLGYSDTDQGLLAIVHLQDRDETVSAGQTIPGTATVVMGVTPTTLTLNTDGHITKVPLEVSP